MFETTILAPFGVEIRTDLRRTLDDREGAELRELMDRHKLLLFRRQCLDEDQQVAVLSQFGRVLGAKGEHRQISSDGNLGAGPLAFHSDLAFTEAPFKYLSLQALSVNDGESWTRFANGVEAVLRLSPELLARTLGHEAITALALIQTRREIDYNVPAAVPQQQRPAIIAHPRTAEPLLFVSEMQTARIEGLDRADSDALLAELFAALYAPDHVYEHHWCNGDLIIWDNFALQHARCDLAGMVPRVLQRVAVADRSFFDLLPQFQIGEARLKAWAAGERLEIEG